MKPKVAINGFGRIGRTLLRVLLQRKEVDVVAIHDVADGATMAHLFKYDSTHRTWPAPVSFQNNCLVIGEVSIPFFQHRTTSLPWAEVKPDVVVECTGLFKTADDLQFHLLAGAPRVLLSAPPDNGSLKTVVLGVNEGMVLKDDVLLSCASCTTNNAAPMIQVVDQLCGIESCYITTVHSYTGDQRLHDAPHKDLRRARAAVESIVPTSTGAAKALTRVFPHLKEKMGGCGMRVPVPNGSLSDITFIVERKIEAATLNAHFKALSESDLFGILEYSEEPLVSKDIVGNPHSCILDAGLTSSIGNMVKVVGWYDNEMGYSNRLADMVLHWLKK